MGNIIGHIGLNPKGAGCCLGTNMAWNVIAQIGVWRYQEHRTVPEMHERLRGRGVQISQRSVTNLLQRYDELVSYLCRIELVCGGSWPNKGV